MLKLVCRSIAAATFAAAAFASLPASAQVGVRVEVPLPGLEIRIGHRAPPRFRSESRPYRPGRDYVWIRGFWDWQGDDWVWIPGRWERPVDRGSRWVRARYVRDGRVWRYEPGHWSSQRLIEGDDYRRWREENRRDRRGDRDRDDDRDRDRRPEPR